jgi:hypothetical protein
VTATPKPYVFRQPRNLRGSTRYNVHDRATGRKIGAVVKTHLGLKAYGWKTPGKRGATYPSRDTAGRAVWTAWRGSLGTVEMRPGRQPDPAQGEFLTGSGGIRVCPACKPNATATRHVCGLAGLQNMLTLPGPR